jgi:hypothetical protein
MDRHRRAEIRLLILAAKPMCGRPVLQKAPGGVRQGRWRWGTPLKKRPPPGVTGVPKLVLVVKPLARLADLAIVPVTAGASCLHVLNGRVY